jgi:hypothetical protein
MPKQRAGEPGYIAGIFNYCDRWCERCAFTGRCLNFALDEQEPEEAPEEAPRQESSKGAFWGKLRGTFASTTELLRQIAVESRIGLDSREPPLSSRPASSSAEESVSNACVCSARAYAALADGMLDFAEQAAREQDQQYQLQVEAGIIIARAGDVFTPLQNQIEVVRWYQHQIGVKLQRAVRGRLKAGDGANPEFKRDADGSAKVALIGIDRSISAWAGLRRLVAEREDEILDLLVDLQRLRRAVEHDFPDARDFVRPGFDE